MTTSYLLSLGLIAFSASASAQSLYQQNFNSLSSSSSAVPAGGYVATDNVGGSGWQIQGGTADPGTVTLTAGINANGVGGSQALFGTWNTSVAKPPRVAFGGWIVT